MATQDNIQDKIIDAALILAQQIGWDFVSLRDIADEADVSLSELRGYFDDKHDILTGFGRRIDRKTLERVGESDPDESPRDRLFDVMMDRFDVLNDEREAVIAILHSFRAEPKQALLSLPHLGKSMNWMLEAAGIDTRGYAGLAKIVGLKIVYLKVLREWCADESPDMGKTMASLDKELSRAEKIAGWLGL